MPPREVTIGPLLVALALACAGPAHVPLQSASFTCEASRMEVFDELYRRVGNLGYSVAYVDAERSRFAVYARALNPPPPDAPSDLRAAEHADVFVVTALEGRVEVTAEGPHVTADRTLDPTLADELRIFADSLERTADDMGRGSILSGGEGRGSAPKPGPESGSR